MLKLVVTSSDTQKGYKGDRLSKIENLAGKLKGDVVPWR